jgi:hypothetical protein
MIHNFERAFSERTISDRSALLGRRVGSSLCNKATLAITVLNRMLAEHEATVGDNFQVIVENVTLIPVTVVRCSLSCSSMSAHEVY